MFGLSVDKEKVIFRALTFADHLEEMVTPVSL